MPDVITYPLSVSAVRVRQPLGEFYAVSLPASILLEVCYSHSFRVDTPDDESNGYVLSGTQREFDPRRAKEIGQFLEGTEAAFPNSIILGVNYSEEGDFLGDEDERSWVISGATNANCYQLTIPSRARVAAIIDGQHRLGGFRFALNVAPKMDLLCAIYLDLPTPFQAYLFATINFNQKRVDKSLAYELFGFDLEGKDPDSWPPEKLAVFLCRRLNVEHDSPLRHRIRVAALNSEAFEDEEGWRVSTATVVEGLLSLISTNPKRDRDIMATAPQGGGRSRKQVGQDNAPLRAQYKESQDTVVYYLVKSFFSAVKELLWSSADEKSYIKRNVGFQALFDVLKELSRSILGSKDLSLDAMKSRIDALSAVNFSDSFFQASGKGRTRLKNTMRLVLGLVAIDKVPEIDRLDYERLSQAHEG